MSMETRVLIIGGVITTLMVIGGAFLLTRQDTSVPEDQIVSKSGIHWHPKLTILIKGEKQEMPANIGIGTQYANHPLYDSMMQMTNIHTHDNSGTLHWEVMKGPVKKDDVKLGQFFSIWDKQFKPSCIFDKCSGEEGKVKMLVNGQENQEFESYHVRDGDNIEIRYE